MNIGLLRGQRPQNDLEIDYRWLELPIWMLGTECGLLQEQ